LNPVLRIDVHQHLWTEPLVEALARRDRPPFIRRSGHVWELTVPGEAPSTIDVVGDEIATREALVHLDGLDVAMVSLSAALGVEGLVRDEAEDVIDAYSAGVAALPNSFAAWGALPLRAADPSDVERVLDAGFVGVSIPAGVIASPSGLERVGPLLEVAQRLAAPVFVHPGLDPFAAQAPAGSDAPFWFPALTSYVAQMNTAWHSFAAVGRKLLPDLQAVFAILAGGAPLHLERLVARGGPAARALNHNFFYETSSYGERAIEAVARVVGIDQLLHGSDRPVVAPPAPPGPLGAAAWDAMTRTTPARLFSTRTRTEIAA
jgi:predicted TIM-barrel fold metal-dependent hydrolase